MDPELRLYDGTFGLTLLFLGVWVVLAVTRHRYPRRFVEFISLPVTDKYFALEGKNYDILHPFNVLLFGVQLVSYASFIYLYLIHFQPEIESDRPLLFVEALTGFAVFVLFKYYFEKLAAYVFNIEKITEKYLFEKLSYTNLIAIVLWAFNLLALYSFQANSTFFYWTLGILILLHIISLISSIKRNYQVIFKSFFYFILYLCALEIAPYIILYKVFQ